MKKIFGRQMSQEDISDLDDFVDSLRIVMDCMDESIKANTKFECGDEMLIEESVRTVERMRLRMEGEIRE